VGSGSGSGRGRGRDSTRLVSARLGSARGIGLGARLGPARDDGKRRRKRLINQSLARSLARSQVSLKLQKRLAASVLKCGKRRIWLDPNEVNEISNANSRQNVKKVSSFPALMGLSLARRGSSRLGE
jgi:hypothetical protein